VQQCEGPRTQPTNLVAASAGRDALHAALAAADAGVDAEALLQALTDIILREPLWCRLRAAQRLDRLDIEGVLPLYQQLVARGEPIPRPELAGPCLPAQPPPPADDGPADDGPPPQLPVDPAEQQEAVRRFLVATSAKDCSVMIAIRRTSQVCPLHSFFSSHPTRAAQRDALPPAPAAGRTCARQWSCLAAAGGAPPGLGVLTHPSSQYSPPEASRVRNTALRHKRHNQRNLSDLRGSLPSTQPCSMIPHRDSGLGAVWPLGGPCSWQQLLTLHLHA
jgi:hypothetical protein